MKQSKDYVLVVQPPSGGLSTTQVIAPNLSCPVITVTSSRQALAQAQADPPHLVILSGEDDGVWPSQIARQIRQRVQAQSIVIVAITDSTDLIWRSEEGTAAIDGILVEPLSADILNALNESAITKKRCYQKSVMS